MKRFLTYLLQFIVMPVIAFLFTFYFVRFDSNLSVLENLQAIDLTAELKEFSSDIKDSCITMFTSEYDSEKRGEVIFEDSAYADNYYYSLLDNNGRIAYSKLYDAAKNLETYVTFHTSYETVEKAILYFSYDYPEYFFLDIYNCECLIHNPGNVNEYVTMEYKDENNDLEYMFYKDMFMSENIVKNVEGLSTREGIKYIHDYIVKNTDYVSTAKYNQDVRSALLNGETVCAGYAKMFKYLCDEAGYDCIYVAGQAYNGKSTGRHAWNMVNIDGEYYWVDVTWDDCLDSKKYFLVSDEKFCEDHFADADLTLPVCSNN